MAHRTRQLDTVELRSVLEQRRIAALRHCADDRADALEDRIGADRGALQERYLRCRISLGEAVTREHDWRVCGPRRRRWRSRRWRGDRARLCVTLAARHALALAVEAVLNVSKTDAGTDALGECKVEQVRSLKRDVLGVTRIDELAGLLANLGSEELLVIKQTRSVRARRC